MSEYSSESRSVGWNSRVAPRTVVMVGAKAPGIVNPGIPTKPGAPPGPPGPSSGAGMFVWEGAGGVGGVQGGIFVPGGDAGEIGGPIGDCRGYCWSSCSGVTGGTAGGVAGVGVVAGGAS